MDPMQGQRSAADSSTEVINTDDETVSTVNSQTSLNNALNPVDARFANYTIPSSGPNFINSGAGDVQSFNGWSSGEPSSRLVPPEHINDIGSKMEHGASNNFCSHSGFIGHGENQVRTRPLSLAGSSANQIPGTVNMNTDRANRVNSRQSSGIVICPNNGGSSFGGSSQAGEGNGGGSGSSLGGWGSSCKRKALEGASGHSIPGGSSGCLSQAESSIWHTGSSQYQASSSLSLSTPSQNPQNIGSRRSTESSGRHIGRRLNLGQEQESVPFSLSLVENLHQIPASAPFVDPLNVRLTTPVNANSSGSETQHNIIHLPALTRNIHHLVWNRFSSSRTGSSSSTVNPGDRFVAPWEDTDTSSVPRNNTEHPMFAPANETRHPVQDQSVWSLTRGNPSASGDVPFASRVGNPSSGVHSLQLAPAWTPHQNTSIHNPQRTSELAPWSLFPSVESESANHGGSFPLLPSGPAISSSEVATPSGSNSRSYRPRPRRSGMLLERQIDDLAHLRHLGRNIAADAQGRHRLVSEIRQVLSAMRRGEDLRVEDYMVIDPLINHGMHEIHDRHRDMRLDVDNMSYEELLALGERIGDVNTGLSEETILKAMKKSKHMGGVATESQQDVEPCCICQEEYAEGDELGTLDCGHEFHTECIKKWIMLKNLCPICKTTGLSP